MATFLDLVKDAATESGTVAEPSTVAGLTGRQARFVRWVQRAWREIQNERSDWTFMDQRFSGQTLDGVRTYDAAALGIANFGDWSFWHYKGRSPLSVYLTSDGPASEVRPVFKAWDDFEEMVLRGDHEAERGAPRMFSVDGLRQIVLYPIPDGIYTLRGRYQSGVQRLTVDTDIPAMPQRYHDAIVWKALTLMARFDEAGDLLGSYENEYRKFYRDMVNDMTPRIRLAGPLGV